MLMAHNRVECDKHSNDNNEILHTDSEIKTLAWCEPPWLHIGEEKEKSKIFEISNFMTTARALLIKKKKNTWKYQLQVMGIIEGVYSVPFGKSQTLKLGREPPLPHYFTHFWV